MAVREALVRVRLALLLLWLRLFLLHCGWSWLGHAQLLGPPEVVIPRRVTGPDGGVRAPDRLSYSLHLEGQRHVVHMRVQKHLLARHMPVFSYSDQGALLEDHPFLQSDCYYHGHVEGDLDSLVVLSTCFGGLRGILQTHDLWYEIEPKELSTTFEHLIYKLDSEETKVPPMRCGLTEEEIARQLKIHANNNFTLMQSAYEGWWTHRRFIELAVVVDNQRYHYKGGNITEVQTEVSLVVSHISNFLKPLDVVVTLMGIEIWTKNNFISVSTIETTLREFCSWKLLTLSYRLPHNVAHIFIKNYYGTTVGLAYVAGICYSYANCGVGSFMNNLLLEFAHTVAHELGHNLGMKHDEPTCVCGHEYCIMYEEKMYSVRFSNCSYAQYWDTTAHRDCLQFSPNAEKMFRFKRCGNSVVEEGEECDCGSLTSCAKDPCCQIDCTLTNGAACAFGLCCKDCKLLPSGTLCRKQESECDLPEWCNGTSYLCPEDVYVQGGVPCSDSGHCHEKRCNDREEQCRKIFGKRAKSADHRCYSEMNTRGDRFGHCGLKGDTYVKCDMEDVLCGRVQCDDVTEIPVLSEHTTVHWTRYNEVTCWGTDYHIGMTIPDIGEVKDGTACGLDRICMDRKCVPMSGLRKNCSQETCNQNGVCNNRDQCHCFPDWVPPFCQKTGQGWNLHSRPFPWAYRHKKGRKYLLSLLSFPLFFISLLVLILFYRLHRKAKTANKPVPTSLRRKKRKIQPHRKEKQNVPRRH